MKELNQCQKLEKARKLYGRTDIKSYFVRRSEMLVTHRGLRVNRQTLKALAWIVSHTEARVLNG